MNDKLFNVGKVVNTFGVRGDVKILPQTDFPEQRFCKGSVLVLTRPGIQEQRVLEIESARMQKNVYIVHFKGVTSMNEAEKLKGGTLHVTEDQLIDLPQDEFYFHEIIGCVVVTENGEQLGVVSEVLTPGANDVWVVERPKAKPLLIPVIDDVILNVDVPNKTIRIHVMEGLL